MTSPHRGSMSAGTGWIDNPRVPHHWTMDDGFWLLACALGFAWRLRKLLKAMDWPD